MTRQAAIAEISPFVFALGQGIYLEDIADVVGMMAYAQAKSPEHLAGLGSGGFGWGTDNSVETHNIEIASPPTGQQSTTVYDFRVWIDSDMQSIRCAARADVPASTTCTVKFVIGAAAATLTFVGATTVTTVTTADLNISSTGSGLVDCTIVVERTAGSGTGKLLAWSVFALPLQDGDLVAPPNE